MMRTTKGLIFKIYNSSYNATITKTKNLTTIEKMDCRSREMFLQRRKTDGQKAQAEILNITNCQRNANQNYSEALPHTSLNGLHFKSLQMTNAGEGVEKRETFYNVGGKVVSHQQPLWRQCGVFLRKLKIKLPYNPEILLLGIYPDKTIIQKDIGLKNMEAPSKTKLPFKVFIQLFLFAKINLRFTSKLASVLTQFLFLHKRLFQFSFYFVVVN